LSNLEFSEFIKLNEQYLTKEQKIKAKEAARQKKKYKIPYNIGKSLPQYVRETEIKPIKPIQINKIEETFIPIDDIEVKYLDEEIQQPKFEKMTIVQLKDYMRKHGIKPLSGTKSVLIARIKEYQKIGIDTNSIYENNIKITPVYIQKKMTTSKQTIAELKQMLKQNGLPVSGKKYELIQRLVIAGLLHPSNLPWEEDTYDKMKVVELKALLKQYGLKISGKKPELIQRLNNYEYELNFYVDKSHEGPYDKMKVVELKALLKQYGLKISGKKSELIARLNESDAITEKQNEEIEAAAAYDHFKKMKQNVWTDAKIQSKINENKSSKRNTYFRKFPKIYDLYKQFVELFPSAKYGLNEIYYGDKENNKDQLVMDALELFNKGKKMFDIQQSIVNYFEDYKYNTSKEDIFDIPANNFNPEPFGEAKNYYLPYKEKEIADYANLLYISNTAELAWIALTIQQNAVNALTRIEQYGRKGRWTNANTLYKYKINYRSPYVYEQDSNGQILTTNFFGMSKLTDWKPIVPERFGE
jgi:hypothetical protein